MKRVESSDVTDQIRLWHPRVLAKYLLSRVTLVPNYCKRCGRDAEPFHVPDSIWSDVIGENGRNVRCVKCFTEEATDSGYYIVWSPQSDANEEVDDEAR